MSGGSGRIIDGGGRRANVARVTDGALHVRDVSGGGGGPSSDVNIAEVGGTPVGGSSVPINDAGGSITVDGSVTVSNLSEPLEVEQATHDNLQCNANLQVGNSDNSALNRAFVGIVNAGGTAAGVSAGGGLRVTSTVQENQAVAAAHDVFPAGVVRDDVLTTLGVADNDWTNLRVTQRGALWSTLIGSTGNQVLVGADGTMYTRTAQVENGAVAAGHTVFPMGVVRDDALTTLGVADGDWTEARVDNVGALWVRERRIMDAFSESTSGQPITISAGISPDTDIHTVPASSLDLVTMHASNMGNDDAILVLTWGGGDPIEFLVPCNQTVSLLTEVALEASQTISGTASFSDVQVLGRVERFPA